MWAEYSTADSATRPSPSTVAWRTLAPAGDDAMMNATPTAERSTAASSRFGSHVLRIQHSAVGTITVLRRTRKPARVAVVRWRPSDSSVAAAVIHRPSSTPARHVRPSTRMERSRTARTAATSAVATLYVPHCSRIACASFRGPQSWTAGANAPNATGIDDATRSRFSGCVPESGAGGGEGFASEARRTVEMIISLGSLGYAGYGGG